MTKQELENMIGSVIVNIIDNVVQRKLAGVEALNAEAGAMHNRINNMAENMRFNSDLLDNFVKRVSDIETVVDVHHAHITKVDELAGQALHIAKREKQCVDDLQSQLNLENERRHKNTETIFKHVDERFKTMKDEVGAYSEDEIKTFAQERVEQNFDDIMGNFDLDTPVKQIMETHDVVYEDNDELHSESDIKEIVDEKIEEAFGETDKEQMKQLQSFAVAFNQALATMTTQQ